MAISPGIYYPTHILVNPYSKGYPTDILLALYISPVLFAYTVFWLTYPMAIPWIHYRTILEQKKGKNTG